MTRDNQCQSFADLDVPLRLYKVNKKELAETCGLENKKCPRGNMRRLQRVRQIGGHSSYGIMEINTVVTWTTLNACNAHKFSFARAGPGKGMHGGIRDVTTTRQFQNLQPEEEPGNVLHGSINDFMTTLRGPRDVRPPVPKRIRQLANSHCEDRR